MCLGGDDGAAERARQEELKRQELIQQGRSRVDKTFGDTFSDDFYNSAQQSYLDYYLPQLDKQFKDTKRQTVLSLSNAGLDASTAAGRSYGDIQEKYDLALDKIRNDAAAYKNSLLGDVTGAKQDLYALVNSGIDPASAGNLAAERAGSLRSPTPFEPITQFFTDIAAQNANRRAAASQGYVPRNKDLLFRHPAGSNVRNIT